MDDETVASFIDLTQATPDKARQYLSISDGNLEQAVNLYFNTDGIDLGDPSTSTPAQPSHQPPQERSRPSRNIRPGEIVNLDSDDEGSEGDTPQVIGHRALRTGQRGSSVQASENVVSQASPLTHVHDDDEAMARRLQEEIYAGGDMNGGIDADGYRAPIARTRETLVGPDSYDMQDPHDLEALVRDQMAARERNRRTGRAQAPGIFNQQTLSRSIWNDPQGPENQERRRAALARATGGASEQSSKSSTLAEMYRPPFEIMSRLSWDNAREEGKANEKWMLVNVQDPAIFDCQVLNRDLWKNAGIQETIQEHFIFMQYSKDDPRGEQYMQYYFQSRESEDAYPHIAIVDPRTGEQVKVWSGSPSPTAADFLMQLHEFLDRYSLNVSAKNPVAKRKAEPKTTKPVERMTEDEMLQMALRNSLVGGSGPREEDPDALTRSTGNLSKGKEKMDSETMSGVEEVPTNGHDETPFARISPSHPHTEPSADEPSTRIQFRHPNGRIVRRFALADTVRRLYEWLKADPMEGKEGHEFELIFMQKNLINALDETVDQAGLRNGTVMVEFIEPE